MYMTRLASSLCTETEVWTSLQKTSRISHLPGPFELLQALPDGGRMRQSVIALEERSDVL